MAVFVIFKHILLIAKQLFIPNFTNMKMESKWREAFSKVVMALLDAKNLSQRQIAIELDTSPSNFNQRILAGSMRPDMIMEFNRILRVDLLKLIEQYERGENLNAIIKHACEPESNLHSETSENSNNVLSILAEQNRTLSDIKSQIQDMANQQRLAIDLLKGNATSSV